MHISNGIVVCGVNLNPNSNSNEMRKKAKVVGEENDCGGTTKEKVEQMCNVRMCTILKSDLCTIER